LEHTGTNLGDGGKDVRVKVKTNFKKFIKIFKFFIVISLKLLDPDPDPDPRGPIKHGSNLIPDPQQWFKRDPNLTLEQNFTPHPSRAEA